MTDLVFTDLDGTLLDRDTYAFEPALAALELLRRRGIPLIPCTSKTAGETLHFLALIGFDGPFIVEDGGGVYVPGEGRAGAQRAGERVRVALAPSRARLDPAIAALREFTEGSIRCFSEMAAEEVAERTGLPLPLARLAKEREFDEPFFFLCREEEFSPRLPAFAAGLGLRVTTGGRFHHLHGDTDKGKAVGLVAGLFRKAFGGIRTLGIGDSALDLPMLRAVDVPIAVLRPDGTVDPVLAAGEPRLVRAPRPGPEGWNVAVLQNLNPPASTKMVVRA